MRLNLSDRMKMIAESVDSGSKVGDIGTDHAYIPISLWQNNIARDIIISDISMGPLEKAVCNINKHIGYNPFEVRLSDGLDAYAPGEIDTAIIAGMGGLLIRDILRRGKDKSRRIKKLILQPRNACAELRLWLLESGYFIVDEMLAREGKSICEIICAAHGRSDDISHTIYHAPDALSLEISPILAERKDPLLTQFIENKLMTERKIARLTESKNDKAHDEAMMRAKMLEELLSRVKF